MIMIVENLKEHSHKIIFYEFILSIYICMYICKDKGPKLYIGPWALAENVGWSED